MRILIAALFISGVFGQGTRMNPNQIDPRATFANPPHNPLVGSIWLFTDAAAPGSCSGGGTYQAYCSWDGTYWNSIGLAGASNYATEIYNKPFISITDVPYSAKGNGTTDDTAAIQTAIDDANATGGGVVFLPEPSVCYKSQMLDISNLTNVTIDGGGKAKICWYGSATSDVGFFYDGTGSIVNVTIKGLEMQGDGALAHRHVGIDGNSGSTIKNFQVLNNYIHDVTLGISINTDLGGSTSGFLVSGNRLENIIGTAPGYGYGIHVADNSGSPADGTIIGNTIIAAHRHDIYVAKGSGISVIGNHSYRHKDGDPALGGVYAAFMIARVTGVTVVGNTCEYAQDGCINIDAGDTPWATTGVTVTGNTFQNPNTTVENVQLVTIGATRPDLDGVNLHNLVFANNVVRVANGVRQIPIEIYSGLDVTVANNQVMIENPTDGGTCYGMEVRGVLETAGTHVYTDDLTVSGNTVSLTGCSDGSTATLESTAADSDITMRFVGNVLSGGGNQFFPQAAQTDPNIIVLGQEASGLTVISPKSVYQSASGSVAPNSFVTTLTASDQITSTLATGTAPLIVSSTTPVANLTTSRNTQSWDSSGGHYTSSPHTVTGRNTIPGGGILTVTLTGGSIFTNNTYDCAVSYYTGAGAAPLTWNAVDGSTIEITGDAGKLASWICAGQ